MTQVRNLTAHYAGNVCLAEYLEGVNTMEKGSVVFVTTTELPSVEVWVASPTGDMSDSHTFHIMCRDTRQAQQLAETWRTTWGIK